MAKKKHIKMVIYADPGVGKSTFVSKMPNPFFITTDGNFEWLDLPDENHIEVHRWEGERDKSGNKISIGVKDVVDDIIANPKKYEQYETIALDLVEDAYDWCQNEFCIKNKIVHIGAMDWGQGYKRVADEFMITIGKLLSINNKHIMLLTHAYDEEKKNPKGTAMVRKYYPSKRVRDVVWDAIEGRCRYFLHAYTESESVEFDDGTIRPITKRYLSILKKDSEPMSIARGIDELNTPADIELDWDVFAEVMGLNGDEKYLDDENKYNGIQSLEQYANGGTTTKSTPSKTTTTTPSKPVAKPTAKPLPKETEEAKSTTETPKAVAKPTTVPQTKKVTTVEEEVVEEDDDVINEIASTVVEEVKEEVVEEAPKPTPKPTSKPTPKPTPTVATETTTETTAKAKNQSNIEASKARAEAVRAKLAAMRK